MSAAIVDQRRNRIGTSARSGTTGLMSAANIANATSTTPMQNRSDSYALGPPAYNVASADDLTIQPNC
jgi:hypothetical protein